MWYINMHLFEPTCKMNVGVDDLATLVGPDDGALVELSSDLVFTRALIPGVATDPTLAAVCDPLTLWKEIKNTMTSWHGYISALTHLPLDKMAAFSQTIFSDAFSWMKFFAFWLKFHWSLFLRLQLTITQH